MSQCMLGRAEANRFFLVVETQKEAEHAICR